MVTNQEWSYLLTDIVEETVELRRQVEISGLFDPEEDSTNYDIALPTFRSIIEGFIQQTELRVSFDTLVSAYSRNDRFDPIYEKVYQQFRQTLAEIVGKAVVRVLAPYGSDYCVVTRSCMIALLALTQVEGDLVFLNAIQKELESKFREAIIVGKAWEEFGVPSEALMSDYDPLEWGQDE